MLVTPSSAVLILDDHLGNRGLHHSTDDLSISIPYEGFKIRFGSSTRQKLCTYLLAVPDNKIRDDLQRSVAAAYFAKVRICFSTTYVFRVGVCPHCVFVLEPGT